ncbi:hypothetical protein [Pectobacterium parvum]|uniref:hypothetical protein n=1 Tax=Pectobacterium parvum TaxID=2778550 RepID=UPI002089C21F|nr:hypothetical protein PEC301879_07410 [Pectobacterium carotovorum subsp. carotovorum]
MNVTVLSKEQWDLIILESPFSTVFHTSWWNTLLSNVFGGSWEPIYLNSKNQNYLLSLSFGGPWGSLGYISGTVGYGGFLPLHSAGMTLNEYNELYTKFKNETNFTLSKVVSIPGVISDLDNGLATRILYFDHRGYDSIFNSFSTSVRTAIRKSERVGISITDACLEDVGEITKLINETQANVGACYLTPYELILGIYMSNKNGYIIKAMYGNKIIAASVFIFNVNEVFHFLNGWDREFSLLNANYGILNYVIKKECKSKSRLNLGSSHSINLDRSKKCGALKSHFIYQ